MMSYLKEEEMNTKAGSRDKFTLELREYEMLRMMMLSANHVMVGAPENISRFFIHALSLANKPAEMAEWKEIADRLNDAMWPTTRYYLDFTNSVHDAETFLRNFHADRLTAKRTILEFGGKILQDVTRKVDPDFVLTETLTAYEEHEENYLTMFIGWIRLTLRKQQKETHYDITDYASHEAVMVAYSDMFYVRDTKTKDGLRFYVCSPPAWADFLKRYPNFPYGSTELLADAYPGYLAYQSGQFREGKRRQRQSFRVLIIKPSALEDNKEEVSLELRGGLT